MKVYTYNDKVLTNSANGKWLKEKEAPAGFVMDGSNATYINKGTSYWIFWQSPSYPNGYQGNGKQYILVNNNSTSPFSTALMYGTASDAGPEAIAGSKMTVLGTSTGVMSNNPAVAQFGINLVWPEPVRNATLEEVQAYMANVSITIVDP